MTWHKIATIQLTNEWQFTPIVKGTYFRLKHQLAPKIPFGWIAQAEILQENYAQLFNIQRVNGLVACEIIELSQPSILVNRVLAFKQEKRIANNWSIEIEVFTSVTTVDAKLEAKLNNPKSLFLITI